MLVYAGTSLEDEIPDASKLFMIMAALMPGIGHEIYFLFDDYDTYREASDALELGSWAGFSVVPHSKIAFRPKVD